MLNDENEETLARLLHLTGSRPAAPVEREARVRRAVLASWERANRRRAFLRRARTAAALLAAAAVVVMATRLWTGRDAAIDPKSAPAIVASVERADGSPGYITGDSIRAGASVETPADGRVALRLADRTSLRLDAGTRLRFISDGLMELSTGALYLDTSAASTGVEVRTPLGIVRDIGTQFEVRVGPSALRISVRTGSVELQPLPQRTSVPGMVDPVSIGPGTQLTVSGSRSETTVISASGSAWAWAASLSPPFDIDGKPLASFLEHLAREYGWTIRYEDAQLARDASGIILHGSVAGLSPEDSLDVALRTSGLSFSIRNGEVAVSRGAGRR